MESEEGVEVSEDALDLLLGQNIELQQGAAVGVGDQLEVEHHSHLTHVQLVDGLLSLHFQVAHQAAAQTGHRLAPAARQPLRRQIADARGGGRQGGRPHRRAQDAARAPQQALPLRHHCLLQVTTRRLAMRSLKYFTGKLISLLPRNIFSLAQNCNS